MLMQEGLHQGSLEHQDRHTALVLLTGHRSKELLRAGKTIGRISSTEMLGKKKIPKFIKALNLATAKHMATI